MASARTKLQLFLYLILITLLLPTASVASTLSGCPDKCGNIDIPHPFGLSSRPDCYRPGFAITCNESTNPPKAFLGSGTVELLDINITSGETRANNFIGYACYNRQTGLVNSTTPSFNLNQSIYLFSNTRNKFTTIGCDTYAYIVGQGWYSYEATSCASFCDDKNSTSGDDGECNGSGCCQTVWGSNTGLNSYELQWYYNGSKVWQFNPCSYAMLVAEDWYKFHVHDLDGFGFYDSHNGKVPFVLDWAIWDGICLESGHENNSVSPACKSENSGCNKTTNGKGYLCKCLPGYDGNPYIPDGCTDIDECKFPDKYPCTGSCTNTEGDYECSCPKGKIGNAKTGNCTINPALLAICSVLAVAIFLGLCFLLSRHRQHTRHIKEKEEYQTYYQLMHNHLRVFSKKQIDTATKNYDENQIVGTGGQGKVYKGYLEDNKPVAIKKSKEVEENQREDFVNEITLLSQINHKNIVRLLGCCLEVKIPILVYEFIPNGTLYDLLHGKSKNRPVSLGTRLNIALESAEALDYLHSSISRSILHGDVKSANILLEDNYRAKVSDFGASNLVPIDDTQIIKVPQGTRGYIDPEYVATAVLTKKSDVYSFGVVIVELITRRYAIFTEETHEKKHLASCFVSNASRNKIHELLDKEIVTTNEEVVEVLQEVSELAVWCLSIKGEDRPTMKQVVEKLRNLVTVHSSLLGLEVVPEEIESLSGGLTSYIASDTSAFDSTGCSSVLEIETRLPR